MLLVRGVGFVGPALVVEVMQQSGDAPELFIGAVLAGIGADAGFHGQHVLAEAFGLRVFAQKLPGVFACGHGVLRKEGSLAQVGQGNEMGNRRNNPESGSVKERSSQSDSFMVYLKTV